MTVLVNRAKMSTATTGTGSITLGSAVDGYQSFSAAGVSNADVVRYVIEDGSNWEIGTGTYSASGTAITRTVSESSNAGAAISLSGAATIFVGATAEDLPSVTAGTLTKSFASNETATIALSSALSPAPVVSVIKEVPQVGVISKGEWDVNSTASNYELFDEAPATSLTIVDVDTLQLGSGSFSASDVGKRIFVDDGGEGVLTSAAGEFIEISSFASTTYTSGNWSLSGIDVSSTKGLQLSLTANNTWNLAAAVYSQNFYVGSQDTSPQAVFFKPDGKKMYILGNSGIDVNEYNLSTAWDVTTSVYSQNFSVISREVSPRGIFFKLDGTKMYIIGAAGDDVNEYNLSTAWDISTSVYSQVFYVGSQESSPLGIFFKSDGLKMYITGSSGDDVNEYNLSTAWDVSTASFLQVFSVAGQDTSPQGIFFQPDGLKMYVAGSVGDAIYEYNLSTAWDVSTSVYLQSLSVNSQDITPSGLFFKPDGLKLYMIGNRDDYVSEYDVGEAFAPTLQYFPSVTSTYGQIDSAFWIDINSMTPDEISEDGEVYYAVSTDDRTTWSVINDADGVRPIVRDNGGTWQYNNSFAYDQQAWANSTTNSELYALQQALTDVSFNRMDKAQLDAVTDPNHYTLGDTLDLMIGLYLGSVSTNTPSSDGVHINYDANTVNQGAILGTDYNYDFPDSTTVRVTSNAAQNLKIRVV